MCCLRLLGELNVLWCHSCLLSQPQQPSHAQAHPDGTGCWGLLLAPRASWPGKHVVPSILSWLLPVTCPEIHQPARCWRQNQAGWWPTAWGSPVAMQQQQMAPAVSLQIIPHARLWGRHGATLASSMVLGRCLMSVGLFLHQYTLSTTGLDLITTSDVSATGQHEATSFGSPNHS